jgi:meiotically up-regulated gene 157 (Mug157) protein
MIVKKPLAILLFGALATAQSCPEYSGYSQSLHDPYSTGKYQLAYQRPTPSCRTFNSSEVESTITRLASVIRDPDLYRLFENSFPNTLDTAIKWRGTAQNNSAEELAFIITGDINAMWLRDSANQVASYLPLLTASSDPDSLASLFRGVINLQARYVLTSPFCNSFQPPVESGLGPATNGAASGDQVVPPYDSEKVFECKYEIDSLAALLAVSANYHAATGDVAFFGRFQWVSAMQAVVSTARAMMDTPTYGSNGTVLASPYMFTRQTTRTTETLANDGLGNPVGSGTGLVRSAFRPSDDSTIYQLFIPGNMMFSRYLALAAEIMAELGDQAPVGLANEMRDMAQGIKHAIEMYGVVVPAPVSAGGGAKSIETGSTIYAYEVDGFGSANIMDDANIPSLLSAPLFGYVNTSDAVYQRTRARILDAQNNVNGNPYFMRGPVMDAVGGPHIGPGMAWPMASIVRILTSVDDDEIITALGQVLSSTNRLGLIHESVNSFDSTRWTRQWFSWANGLFGQMILDLEARKPGILSTSFQ